ncbi:MAG TPA: hypothetical protein VMY87_01740 [Armatimonadota bacterium]|nr:hypothetical protein [Armatimonadota bacterium]
MAEELGAIGPRVAQRFVFRGVRPKPSDLAEQLGVEVVREESPPPAQPRLRSEYRAEPARIILYRDTIDQLAVAIHADQRFDMMQCDLAEVHVAHELFHHLEFGQRFGPLTVEEVEAGAHAFAQELLELGFHPTEFSEMVG